MRTLTILAVWLVAASCGKKEDAVPTPVPAPAAEGAVAPAAVAPVNSGPDCTKVKPAASSTPNILGVTLGMKLDDASLRLSCEPGYEVQFQPVRSDEEAKATAPHRIIAIKGLDSLEVVAIGVPGDERVIGLLRAIAFDPGNQPTVESLEGEATKKYGEMARYQAVFKAPNSTLSRIEMTGPRTDCSIWSEGLGFNNNLISINPSCGLFVRVMIMREDSNPGLAKSVIIMIADNKKAEGYRDAYMESKRRAEQAAREQELERAKGNTPTL